MASIKLSSKRPWVIGIIVLVIIVLLLVLFNQCSKKPNIDLEENVVKQDFRGEIEDINTLEPGDYAVDSLPDMECSQGAVLYIADGPGKPQESISQTTGWLPLDNKKNIENTKYLSTDKSSNTNVATRFVRPIYPIKPIQPIPINPPSSVVKIIKPESGSVLTASSNYNLEWSVDSARDITVDILFSGDGGLTYQEIAMGIVNDNSFKLTVPDVSSDTCLFRVNAWVGTALLGYNTSPTFTVIEPEKPIEKPVEEPTNPLIEIEPKKEYPPSTYIEGDNVFINENEDATRWFTIDHKLTDVTRVVWQLSRVPFSCESEKGWGETPGLLAWGFLDGQEKEFSVDFNAIMERFKVEKEAEKTNQGSVFETTPDSTLIEQVQRELYIRAVMLDEQDKIVGSTRSGFQIIYGNPTMDQVDYSIIDWMPNIPEPELSIKTTSGFDPGMYKDIPDKGLFLYAGGDKDWGFKLDEVPTESVEIDLQISTIPYNDVSVSDFKNPDGLVYRSKDTGLSYTTKTRYYPVSFIEFAPPITQLDTNTIIYYIRAVCYVPIEGSSTVVPVVSKTHKIYYTGDKKLYLINQIDIENMEPEEVVVKSYVPTTEFYRYYPAQWALKNHKEYFEVTRPIQAEEIGFYIKNNVTGDFLYPYPMHMYLYPNTTKEQYQAIVDRMLPPGAWFQLTMTQSNWDALWDEFFDLLDQVYSSIQQNYNGLKVSLANQVADRFAFLGDDVQGYIRTGVHALIDYGLASVGLPPTLPNFSELADVSIDYSVKVALQEAAQSMGIPPEQIPNEVKNEIIDETKAQLEKISAIDNVNPLSVDYLKPAEKAMYQPAWVDVNITNPHDQWSPTGTLTISYYPVGKPHFKLYNYVSLPIPSLAPNASTFIRVHLTPDNTGLPVWKEYYWGDIGDCTLNITATYDVPDVEIAAQQQDVNGDSEMLPDAYVYDVDPVFTFSRTNIPANPLYD